MTSVAQKYAVILNGDSAPHHRDNVDLAVKTLKADGYQVFVSSYYKPKGRVDGYQPSDLAGFQNLVEGLSQKMSKQDELVVYTTGHGSKDEKTNEGKICLKDKCYGNEVTDLLEKLPYQQRTIIMDNCFGGNWNKIFLGDPKTLFITGGSSDEMDWCQEFAPKFWAPENEIPDLNMDGQISWQERFAHVFEDRPTKSFPQFVFTPDYIPEARFDQGVISIQNEFVFQNSLASLKPGQYALVMYDEGADQSEIASFEDQSTTGAYLFIRTQDKNIARHYGIESGPAYFMLDHQGQSMPFFDGENLLTEAGFFQLTHEQRLNHIEARLQSNDEREQLKGLQMAGGYSINLTRKENSQLLRLLARIASEGAGLNQIKAERLIEAVTEVTLQLTKPEADLGGTVLRQFFVYPDKDIRMKAASAYTRASYKVFAPLFSATELNQGVLDLITLIPEGVFDVLYERPKINRLGLIPDAPWVNLLQALNNNKEKIDYSENLKPYLYSDDKKSRSNALLVPMKLIGSFPDDSNLIISYLQDPSENIRLRIAGILNYLSEGLSDATIVEITPSLVELFSDKKQAVSNAAILAYMHLAEIRPHYSFELHMPLMRNIIAHQRDLPYFFYDSFIKIADRLPAIELAEWVNLFLKRSQQKQPDSKALTTLAELRDSLTDDQRVFVTNQIKAHLVEAYDYERQNYVLAYAQMALIGDVKVADEAAFFLAKQILASTSGYMGENILIQFLDAYETLLPKITSAQSAANIAYILPTIGSAIAKVRQKAKGLIKIISDKSVSIK